MCLFFRKEKGREGENEQIMKNESSEMLSSFVFRPYTSVCHHFYLRVQHRGKKSVSDDQPEGSPWGTGEAGGQQLSCDTCLSLPVVPCRPDGTGVPCTVPRAGSSIDQKKLASRKGWGWRVQASVILSLGLFWAGGGFSLIANSFFLLFVATNEY